jgi:3-oxoacyl-(acyl-carrier-protein) synthase
VHPSINCEDVHPEIAEYAPKIPQKCLEVPELRIVAKAGFGFGDVNSCIIFKKWDKN